MFLIILTEYSPKIKNKKISIVSKVKNTHSNKKYAHVTTLVITACNNKYTYTYIIYDMYNVYTMNVCMHACKTRYLNEKFFEVAHST